ncbi:MAG: aminoglycoside phosphotransferase family protein [Chromatiales bacterium]|nr:aminoglycoside phosphotransferase family protein [Chromatiales bacterium]
MSDEPLVPPGTVLAAWRLGPARTEPLGKGLINRTWLVTMPARRYVLQRVNPMFPPSVNLDIEAVTGHLAARGMQTPRLVRTHSGALVLEQDGGCWRLMSWMPGLAPERVSGPAMAEEAGRLLGRFHAALADLAHEFSSPRTGIHDTQRHLAVLGKALHAHGAHPSHAEVAPLGESILAAAEALPALPPGLPLRIVHGDPKLNNLLFDPRTGQGLCLVDLDTLGRMEIPLELGDALRSWSNPGGEDSAGAGFDLALCEAALRGYVAGSGGLLGPGEQHAIADATATIMLELAARFCADALNESYFGWDPARFPSRGAHNLVRAQGQFALFRDFLEVRDSTRRMVRQVFAAS